MPAPHSRPSLKATLAAFALLASLTVTAHAGTTSSDKPSEKQNADAPASSKSTTPAKPLKLDHGMSAAQVLAAVGKPTETRTIEKDDVKATVWIYRFAPRKMTTTTSTNLRTETYIDPITNTTRQVAVPDYSLVTKNTREVIELLFIKEVLVGSKRYQEETNEF